MVEENSRLVSKINCISHPRYRMRSSIQISPFQDQKEIMNRLIDVGEQDSDDIYLGNGMGFQFNELFKFLTFKFIVKRVTKH